MEKVILKVKSFNYDFIETSVRKANLNPAYGTAAFYESMEEDPDSGEPVHYCTSRDSELQWVYKDTGVVIQLQLIKGDLETAIKLTKAEIEHFDTEVIIGELK